MKTLFTYIQLSRPLNGIIAFISAGLGGVFASGYANESIRDVKLLYVCLATLLLLSAGNAINDYCDYHIDLINKPKRPLPSGRIPRNHALIFTIVLIGIGIGLGVLINIYAVGIAILVSVLLVSYAMWLKRTPLIGNLVVGCLTGITFISGGVAIGTVRGTLVPAVFAFLFTTAREIVKDLEDIEGDKRQNIRTLAILNTRLAVIFALSFIVAVIVFSPIPYIFGWYSWHYLVVIVLGVDLVLMLLVIRLCKDASKPSCAFVQRCMKWDIFVGLMAIYLGMVFKI